MTKATPVSVRLEPDLNDRVGAIAALMDRPKSWAIAQAVRDFVEIQEWQLAAIDEGLRAADEGRLASHDEVAAWVRSWDRADEKPMPKCS
ncbi:MAG TPA: CopG family ribbon-helix-helix protein [Caulobacteraceae bacterium]